MKISGTNGMNISAKQINMSQASDSVSKNIQKQIANVQKSLQELSEKNGISAEEKIKKRQELQQQIADLNRQLRQHQMEKQKEEQQQTRKSSMEDMLENEQKETNDVFQDGMSKQSIKAMVSADSAIEQAKVYKGVATHLGGEVRNLQSEISLDEKRGINVENKKKELSKIEGRVQKATSSQIGTLKHANIELKEAKEKERKEKDEDSRNIKNHKKASDFNSQSITKGKKAVLSISSNSEKNSRKTVDIQW